MQIGPLTYTEIILNPRGVYDLNGLSKSVSPSAPEYDHGEWLNLIRQPGVTVGIGALGNQIVAMGTLIIVQIPTRVKAYMEDVVVDEHFRRRGLAQGIEKFLLDIAAKSHAKTVYLTSSRLPAQQLWERCGWSRGATQAYYKHIT